MQMYDSSSALRSSSEPLRQIDMELHVSFRNGMQAQGTAYLILALMKLRKSMHESWGTLRTLG